MASRNRFICTAFSTLTVTGALCMGLQPTTADAAPDPVLTAGLLEIAEEMGDAFGHIVTQNQAGATIVFARYVRGYTIYTGGNPVATNDTLAFCQQNGAGGLIGCQPLPPPNDYEPNCHVDPEGGDWCECDGVYDCIELLRSNECGDDWACDDTGCACVK
jgi:hypothetical protein